jgi:hypothetical protein
MFLLTLGLYMVATVATAFAFDALVRSITVGRCPHHGVVLQRRAQGAPDDGQRACHDRST